MKSNAARARPLTKRNEDPSQSQGGKPNTFRQIAAPPLCKKSLVDSIQRGLAMTADSSLRAVLPSNSAQASPGCQAKRRGNLPLIFENERCSRRPLTKRKEDPSQSQGGSSNTFRQIAAPPLCKNMVSWIPYNEGLQRQTKGGHFGPAPGSPCESSSGCHCESSSGCHCETLCHQTPEGQRPLAWQRVVAVCISNSVS